MLRKLKGFIINMGAFIIKNIKNMHKESVVHNLRIKILISIE